MRRFWIDSHCQLTDSEFEISGETYHHIVDVCRMQVGSKFELLVNKKAYLVELSSLLKKRALAQILETRDISSLQEPFLHLCVSLPRFQTFEGILEKSVELGVAEIHPFFSQFSFVKSLNKISPNKSARWKKIIQSATQQTGRGDLMPLHEPQNLKDLLQVFNQNPKSWGLFPYEGKAEMPLQTAISSWDVERKPEIWIFIGSEGGFSDQEVELFQEYGMQPATLGEQILRVETACLALTSVIKYHVGAFSESTIGGNDGSI